MVHPHAGVWVVMYEADMLSNHVAWFIPIRGCGLKSYIWKPLNGMSVVHPHAGVWVEIYIDYFFLVAYSRSSPYGGVG